MDILMIAIFLTGLSSVWLLSSWCQDQIDARE